MEQVKQMELDDFLGGLLKKASNKKAEKPATCKETAQTRRESNEKTVKVKKYTSVLNVLGSDVMTAREIAEEMHKRGTLPYPARAIIQPRITELVEAGVLKVVGKKLDEVTNRNVAQYWRVTE